MFISHSALFPLCFCQHQVLFLFSSFMLENLLSLFSLFVSIWCLWCRGCHLGLHMLGRCFATFQYFDHAIGMLKAPPRASILSILSGIDEPSAWPEWRMYFGRGWGSWHTHFQQLWYILEESANSLLTGADPGWALSSSWWH